MKMNFKDVESKIKDRGIDPRATASDLLATWGFDLTTRSMGPAYIDENGKPVTKLDMICLLSALCEWGAVINLETYKAAGPRTHQANQIVVSTKNRHGKLVSLIGNQDLFNVSVRILDMNVMDPHNVGAYRNFLLMRAGEWHGGFDGFQFVPDREENKVIAQIAQKDNVLTFEHLVSPHRWPSIYGAPYMLAKLMAERIAAEKSWLDGEIRETKDFLKLVPVPSGPRPVKEKGDKEKVWAVNVEVDPGPELTGKFAPVARTKEGLEDAQNRKSRINALLERLRLQTRLTEWAFWQKLVDRYGGEDAIVELCEGTLNTDKVPLASWAMDVTWKSVRATPRSAAWLTATMHGYKLRMRQWKKSVDVAASISEE